MFQIRRNFLVALCALFAMIVGFSAVAPEAQAKGKPIQLQGILVGVNANTSTVVVRRAGVDTSVVLPAGIKIERNGVRVGLAAFKNGDRVQVRYANDGVTIIRFEGTGL